MPSSDRISIGVIVECRAIDHPWQDSEWRVSALLPGVSGIPTPQLIDRNDSCTRYLAAVMPLSLHTTETEAYIFNLTARQPSLYVAMRETAAGSSPLPWDIQIVTANPYEAEHYITGEGELVEKLPLEGEVRHWVEAFVAEHHSEQPFYKRKRKRHDPEEYQFGQEPIAQLRARLGHLPGEDDHG